MKDYPLVTVLIPCYNAQAYLQESIESVLNQTYPNIEIIAINDGSTDNTLNILNIYNNKIKIFTTKNNGQSAAINYGLERSNGKFIKCFDSDDVMMPTAIENQVNSILSLKSNNVAVYGNLYRIDQDGKIFNKMKQKNINLYKEQMEFLLKEIIVTGLPLHYKENLVKVKGFDVNFGLGNDFDLNIRLYLSGVKFHYFDDLIYHYRQYNGEDRLSSKGWVLRNPSLGYNLLEKSFKYIESLKPDLLINQKVKYLLAEKHFTFARNLFSVNNDLYALKHIKEGKVIYKKEFLPLYNDFYGKIFFSVSKIIGLKKTNFYFLKIKSIKNKWIK